MRSPGTIKLDRNFLGLEALPPWVEKFIEAHNRNVDALQAIRDAVFGTSASAITNLIAGGVTTAAAAAAAAISAAALTLTTVGGTTNATGGTITGSVLQLHPADTVNQSYYGLIRGEDLARALLLGGTVGVPTIQTDDATPTNSELLTTIANDYETVTIELSVAAQKLVGSDAASYGRRATFKTVAGVLSQVGATTPLWTHENVAGWDVNFVTAGVSIYAEVTGQAATDIDWTFSVRVFSSLGNYG